MKSMFLTGLVAGAVGGAVASVVVGTLARAPRAAEPVVVEAEGLQVAALERRLDELLAADRELGERLRMVEDRPALAPSREVVAAAPERAATGTEQPPAASLADPEGKLPDGFREGVDQALRSIREEEERVRDEQRRERFETRLDERLGELSLELGLTQYQSVELRKVLIDLNGKREGIMQSVRDNGDWSSVRDQMRELRTTTESSLQLVLDADQYERFMDGDGGGMIRGPGGFGGGGDDGRDRDRRGPGDN